MICFFDSEKGIASSTISFRRPRTQNNNEQEYEFVSESFSSGDMLRSSFITITERNYPTADNKITAEQC